MSSTTFADPTKEQAFELAKKLYAPYILRGDTLKHTVSGCMGCGCREWSVQLGGYHDGKRLNNHQVVVDMRDDNVYIFTIEEIYEAVQRPRPKQGRLL